MLRHPGPGQRTLPAGGWVLHGQGSHRGNTDPVFPDGRQMDYHPGRSVASLRAAGGRVLHGQRGHRGNTDPVFPDGRQILLLLVRGNKSLRAASDNLLLLRRQRRGLPVQDTRHRLLHHPGRGNQSLHHRQAPRHPHHSHHPTYTLSPQVTVSFRCARGK